SGGDIISGGGSGQIATTQPRGGDVISSGGARGGDVISGGSRVGVGEANSQTPAPQPTKKKKKPPTPGQPATPGSDTEPGDSATAAAAPTTQPLQITSGDAVVSLSLSRDAASKTTHVQLTNLQVNKLGLKRGDKPYQFSQPITLKL